jgi:hypothetical protein
MEALEQKTGEERIEMLKMLVQTHLISEDNVRKGIEAYTSTTAPANVPQVTPSVGFPAPTVPDARIFLLAVQTIQRKASMLSKAN